MTIPSARDIKALTHPARSHLCAFDRIAPVVKKMRNLGVLGAYDSFPHKRRICVQSTADTFITKLKELYSQGKIVNASRLLIMTATSEKRLFDPDWEYEIKAAERTINSARAREDGVAINRLNRALRSTGKPPGPVTKKETHRNIIADLKRLKANEKMKSIAGADAQNKQARAAHTNVRRFCLEVYDVWMRWSILNPPDNCEKYNSLIQKYLQKLCHFKLPSEKSIARFAFERAKNRYSAATR